MTLGELNFKRKLCQEFIRVLEEIDDPRKDDAIKGYKLQLAEIDRKITELTGKPPAITVGLKTAKLSARSRIGG